jgi:hypothetical protein
MIPQYIEWIAADKLDKFPTIDGFATSAVAPITWPGMTGFTPTGAAFSDGLLISGDLSAG